MTDIEADLMIANAEIKRLQAQLAELREDCDITDAANTALHGALQEAERREKAAVEDLCGACERLCRATGHGWVDGCDQCEWRGVQAEKGEGHE